MRLQTQASVTAGGGRRFGCGVAPHECVEGQKIRGSCREVEGGKYHSPCNGHRRPVAPVVFG